LKLVRNVHRKLTVASRNSNAEIAGRLASFALAAAGGNPFKVKAHRRAADKIARCVSVEDLRQQLRFIDKLNGRLKNIRVLKSAEVDILADGSLDYPDDLLAELDYTVCSIHSRFNFGKRDRTERILRAVDIRYFNILGHATDPRLLKRPGYEIDLIASFGTPSIIAALLKSMPTRDVWISLRKMSAPWPLRACE